jgi:hypothetical protein
MSATVNKVLGEFRELVDKKARRWDAFKKHYMGDGMDFDCGRLEYDGERDKYVGTKPNQGSIHSDDLELVMDWLFDL